MINSHLQMFGINVIVRGGSESRVSIESVFEPVVGQQSLLSRPCPREEGCP